MQRTSFLLLAAALTLPACDAQEAKPASGAAEEPGARPAGTAEKGEAPAAEGATDPWQQKLASRVLADSGLGVGSKLSPFDIVNCESGEEYCQVCRFGGSPKIMVIGAPTDEKFQRSLKDVDAMVKRYGEDKVKAFAVVTELKDGKAITPADAAAAQKGADELRRKLAVSIPVVIPSPGDSGKNKVWEDYYNVTQSPTIMFADGRNEVKYSAVGPEDFSELDTVVSQVLGS